MVVLHAWVSRRQAPAEGSAASAERLWLAYQETEEARLRADLLCRVMQALQKKLDNCHGIQEWADRVAPQFSSASMSEGLAIVFRKHVEQVAALLCGAKDTARRLLAFALPFHIVLRTRALLISGANLASDPVLLALRSDLERLGGGTSEALREELQQLCNATQGSTAGVGAPRSSPAKAGRAAADAAKSAATSGDREAKRARPSALAATMDGP